ncbi:ankyrin repeat domain-containing protein [Desulfosarcina cetonica]|uniref:ankyrin repeat domain-containing protein n=1 Tax=Desulfosarcina cetonica TaxID=90730 RepID=UPI0009F8B0C5|nr:ankyrin repeat domain-containing protein [Desulfosarcina cetonica]
MFSCFRPWKDSRKILITSLHRINRIKSIGFGRTSTNGKKKREKERLSALNIEKASHLVVIVQGQFGDGPTAGGGIIFGFDEDRLYIATANHVVRRGGEVAHHLQVRLRSRKEVPDNLKSFSDAFGDPPGAGIGKALPAEPCAFEAELLDRFSVELDLAVLTASGLSAKGASVCLLPYNRGPTRGSQMARGTSILTIGHPNGYAWAVPIAPDFVTTIGENTIDFQSNFIAQGSSGGAVIDLDGCIRGMITADSPPFGRALRFEQISEMVQKWRYPFVLRPSDEYTVLSAAVHEGDIDRVTYLLNLGCKPDDSGYPLDLAMHDPRMVEVLLSAGANPNAGLAAPGFSVSVESLKMLLARGVDIDSEQAFKALYSAIVYKQAEIVKILLNAGATVDSKHGVRLLSAAARKDQTDIVRMLLKKGAGGRTRITEILNLALESQNPEIDALLLADIEFFITAEQATRFVPIAVQSADTAMLAFLLNHGGDPNTLVRNKPNPVEALLTIVRGYGFPVSFGPKSSIFSYSLSMPMWT